MNPAQVHPATTHAESRCPVAAAAQRCAGPRSAWPFAARRRCLPACALAAPPEAAPEAAQAYDTQVRPILATHCLECHGIEKPKGDLRLDRLKSDLADAEAAKTWQKVLERIQSGEMPPEEEPRLSAAELQQLGDWISGGLQAAAAARRAGGRVVLRRLNRAEYENTVRDLLHVDVDLKDLLPLDTAANGFDNIGDALHVSSFLMDRYLDAADKALGVAIANRPQPPASTRKYDCRLEHGIKNSTERVFRFPENELVTFSSSHWNAVVLWQFYPSDRGRYRIRIPARGVQSAGKPVTFRIDAGSMLMGEKNHLAGYYDAPADKTAMIELVDRFEPTNTIRILPYALANAQTVDKIGADVYDGPGLALGQIEVEGPLYDAWPPESHRRIFGELKQASAPSGNQADRLEVVSDQPAADAERIVRAFVRRAFRRPVSEERIEPILALVRAKLAEGRSFEQAVRVGLMATLAAPEFLFLDEQPGPLDDYALASRLSYFLWSTMPDDELGTLAEAGRLGDAEVLAGQVERMLCDPRSAALVDNFVGQWLGLRDIDFTLPSQILYPEFDDLLRVSMQREVELFFAELLKQDLSVANFVASDFSLLNGRLAQHYGIPGVDGWEFRKVQLPADSHRGGVLTMAAVLKVTANGTNTSPVTRGAWVLDRILGTPPPKPPENVAALEPDIRGATTIREQLAKHRQIATCASCHTHIDPPGFALESFDVIGGWREHYRVTGNGREVMLGGRRMPYLEGLPVDPTGSLAVGRTFKDIDELKALLLADKDQIARALTIRLLTYGTGGAPEAADGAEIERIVAQARERNYGLRTLVHAIVQSPLFRRK